MFQVRIVPLLLGFLLGLAVPVEARGQKGTRRSAGKEQRLLLFNGKDLAGWKLRSTKTPSHWKVTDGVLVNTGEKGTDLYTEAVFEDFQLHVEFNVPKGSNSGVYLRGLYEVQITDAWGKKPSDIECGALCHVYPPRVNACKEPGQWQTFDITLVGRQLTVVHNGVTVLDKVKVPGKSPACLEGIEEGKPGPIMLQGDHGPVSFRNLWLRPLR
jgi:hypothetical protein